MFQSKRFGKGQRGRQLLGASRDSKADAGSACGDCASAPASRLATQRQAWQARESSSTERSTEQRHLSEEKPYLLNLPLLQFAGCCPKALRNISEQNT